MGSWAATLWLARSEELNLATIRKVSSLMRLGNLAMQQKIVRAIFANPMLPLLVLENPRLVKDLSKIGTFNEIENRWEITSPG